MEDGFDSSPYADKGDTKSSGDQGLTTGVKAGIAVVVIGGIAIGVLAVLGISQRQRWKKSKTQYNSPDAVGWMEEGGTVADALPTVGGVQRQPGEFRKERKPNWNMSKPMRYRAIWMRILHLLTRHRALPVISSFYHRTPTNTYLSSCISIALLLSF